MLPAASPEHLLTIFWPPKGRNVAFQAEGREYEGSPSRPGKRLPLNLTPTPGGSVSLPAFYRGRQRGLELKALSKVPGAGEGLLCLLEWEWITTLVTGGQNQELRYEMGEGKSGHCQTSLL